MTTPRRNGISINIILFIATLLLSSSTRAEQQGSTTTTLTSAQLEQLVAPIALYPDALVSQILMASTYPLEVVEAARWSSANPGITGQALEEAMQKQDWDPSVRALTAVPQTLQMMNDKLDWTQDLGEAFLAQQSDLLDAVQRLRARAEAAGNLKSTPQQTVRQIKRPANLPPASGGGGASGVGTGGGGSAGGSGAPVMAYEIVPTNPDQYYVPIYDPNAVYGAWPYPDYEPFYWYPPGYVGTGLWGWGTGFFAGAAIWAGVNWWNRDVNINVNRYNQFNRTNIRNGNWAHNPAHRRGAAYNNQNLTNRFGDQGRGKARQTARQNMAQRGMGQGGMGGQAGKGQGGMGGKGIAGGMGQSSKGQGGMGQRGMGGHARGMGGQASRGGHAGRGGQAGMGRQAGGMGGHAGRGGHGGMAGAPRMAGGGMMSAPRGLSAGGPRGFGGGGAGGFRGGGGGGFRGGGGGFRGGGGGGFRGGGGRRSDIELKEDVSLLGYLANGIGFYRFAYKGNDTAYVGVMAQEVQQVRPDAVIRGRDGYLRVFYDKLGIKFQTHSQWQASGAQVPAGAR